MLFCFRAEDGILRHCVTGVQTCALPIYAVADIQNDDRVLPPPGKDAVTILDISDRMNPRIVASLALMNSVFGPPVNLAITPDETLALVANSMDWVQDGAAWKGVPGSDIFVIDLKSNPPALVSTVKAGRQPSGMAINRAGNLALVTNRADNSMSVLSFRGRGVKVVDTEAMGDQVAA